MSYAAAGPQQRPRSRVLLAAAWYFAIVCGAELLLCPLRVLWLEPWLGKTLAVLCEAPIFIFAMWFGARAALRWASVRGSWLTFLAAGEGNGS